MFAVRLIAAASYAYCTAWFGLWELTHKAADAYTAAHYGTPLLRLIHYVGIHLWLTADGTCAALLTIAIALAWRMTLRITAYEP